MSSPPSPDTTAVPAWLPLAAVGVTLVFWASAFVGHPALGAQFTPGALSLGRLVFGAVALGVALLVSRGLACPTRREWLGMAAVGVLWFGIYNVALNAGERRIDAGTAAMLIQVSPILVAVLACSCCARSRPRSSRRASRWRSAASR